MVGYFFDTYALIEALQKNSNYLRFAQAPAITGVLNRIELGWWALLRHDEQLMDIVLEAFSHAEEITDDVIRNALKFRKKYYKRNLSYADAIGYTFAQKHNLLFLTGDEQFKDLPGVEFVK